MDLALNNLHWLGFMAYQPIIYLSTYENTNRKKYKVFSEWFYLYLELFASIKCFSF